MGMNWYEILLSARQIGSQEVKEGKKRAIEAIPFTSAALAEETDLTPPVASAWIGKFKRWGYAIDAGKEESAGGRPARLYALTKWGLIFKRKKKGKVSKPKNIAVNKVNL
jgi:hypothetical protein